MSRYIYILYILLFKKYIYFIIINYSEFFRILLNKLIF